MAREPERVRRPSGQSHTAVFSGEPTTSYSHTGMTNSQYHTVCD
jgi:hypothetical protein